MESSKNRDLGRKMVERGDDFFKAVIDGMQCGFISIDSSGNVVKINEIAKRILGLEGKTFSGKRFSETEATGSGHLEGVHIKNLLEPFPHLSKIMLESCHMSTLPNRDETEIQLEGKGKKKIGFTISLVKNRNGRDIGCSMFFKDLTKIEEMEEQEHLKERLAALGHMSASLAHELRNPLAAIEVNASYLKRMLRQNGEAASIIDGIISDITRLKTTINDSLSFVKPLDVNMEPCRIEDLIGKAISSSLTKHDQERIEIRKRYLNRFTPLLLDADLLVKALINILRNAVEAMEGSGTIYIELSNTGGSYDAASEREHLRGQGATAKDQKYVIIRIRDTGKGIPGEVIDKIFYPFFTTKEKGSGLGLSFTKKVVDAHKGIIDVESRVGSGTIFTIRLPIISGDRKK
ncbi:MAG: ATP-binding protein [Acidobacteriota bacterium]